MIYSWPDEKVVSRKHPQATFLAAEVYTEGPGINYTIGKLILDLCRKTESQRFAFPANE
jgi:hypothetical protein